MSKTEQYRGQDTILEMIKNERHESDGCLTWNEACDNVAEQFANEGLTTSAGAALQHRIGF